MSAAAHTTQGHLLDGRVKYVQPRVGFRSGIEPVLLAASIPAKAGERVLEAGCGAGAALLCLHARVPGVEGIGIERDFSMAELAQANAEANHAERLRFVAAPLESAGDLGVFDHAFANPPYHSGDGTRSPWAERNVAKRGHAMLLRDWAAACGPRLRRHGTLTFILPAAVLAECLAAFAMACCGAHVVLPLWPRVASPAKLVLVQGAKESRSPLRLLPGLVLHENGARFTAAANAVLRDGAALPLGEYG